MKKKKNIHNVLNVTAFFCFIFALCLAILTRMFRNEAFLDWYGKYTNTLLSYELWMQTYGASAVSVIFILVNYAVKAVIPWFPISCICVVAGALFSWYYAVIINFAGLAILFSIKFFWGRKFGGGNAEKLLGKSESLHNFIDKNQKGSPFVLFILRLLPFVPVNSVSGLYGSTDISYGKFIAVSFIGFTYKVFSYTIIGRNVFDPASASFVVPFIVLSVMSGFVILIVSKFINVSSTK